MVEPSDLVGPRASPEERNCLCALAVDGERLNKLYKNSVTHDQIIECLKPIFIDFAKNRENNERFGDFTIRAGYVNATNDGNAFHSDLKDIQYQENA